MWSTCSLCVSTFQGLSKAIVFHEIWTLSAGENTEPRVFKLPAVCAPSRHMEDAKMYNRGVTPVQQYGSWNDVWQQIFEQSASFVKVIIVYYVT